MQRTFNIDAIRGDRLAALRPILAMLAGDEPLQIDSELTDDDWESVELGLAEYRADPGSCVTLGEFERRQGGNR
jgi:hypothetical protein